ncbi:hypothetical protein GCM10007036_31210 [Alsobacter metallidurans]|uniref:Uncharacterized protein n=1 Tax=Alsobacter metallidurans TaxID=340221 RepID=A0A917I8H7_9HYPH|nr:hypothetical protein GCM10007036_31210 [Alsobacter metallidurans]
MTLRAGRARRIFCTGAYPRVAAVNVEGTLAVAADGERNIDAPLSGGGAVADFLPTLIRSGSEEP